MENGDTVREKGYAWNSSEIRLKDEMKSKDDVISPEAPDFYYSMKHLEQERLFLRSEVHRLQKSNREQFESQQGEQFEIAQRFGSHAEEIERAQQILNHYEIQYLSEAKLKQKMK